MEKVVNQKNEHVGWSWVCSWCHDCGPVKPTKDEAVTDYLEHQSSPECIIAEEKHVLMRKEMDEVHKAYLAVSDF